MNTTWWFYGSQAAFNKVDKSNFDSLDVGIYYPLKGLSNTEISAMSRSMHKCQGFGRVGTRGKQMEYLELLKGSKGRNDFMGGVNTTWSRVPGGEKIGTMVAKLQKSFDFSDPVKAIPELIEIKKSIEQLAPSYWTIRKMNEINKVIEYTLGLYVEAHTDERFVLPGKATELNIEVTQRNDYPVQLSSIKTMGASLDTTMALDLTFNERYIWTLPIQIDPQISLTNPYWLNEEPELGRFVVNEQTLVGKPENDSPLKAYFNFSIGDEIFSVVKNIVHRRSDPVKAAIYEPLQVVAPAYVNMEEEISIFNGGLSKTVSVTIRASQNELDGILTLDIPEGWKINPESHEFGLEKAGEEKTLQFEVQPPHEASEGTAFPKININDRIYSKSWRQIAYDHIPTQTVMQTAKAKWVNIDIQRVGHRIGYIMGAGDDVPKHLEQVGYQVESVRGGKTGTWPLLNNMMPLCLGIRAYNTLGSAGFLHG